MPDPYGERPESQGDAPLLFDPNAADPEEFGPARPDAGRSPGLLLYGAVAVAVVALGVVGFLLVRPAEQVIEPEIPTATPGATVGRHRIEVVPDSVIVAEVGTAVVVTFRVTDPADVPQADFELSFEVSSGDGVLDVRAATTDSLGLAQVEMVLPERPGETLLSASSPDGAARAREARLVASVGAPASIAVAAGNRQEAPMGELLPERVAVVVRDAVGNPVYNAEVRFQVEIGEGLTAPSLTRTDSTGRASALWRLGRMEGRHELTAIASGTRASVTFVATAGSLGSAPEDVPPEASAVRVRPVRLAVGGSHVCTVAGGATSCRGSSNRGQLAGSGNDRFIAVTAGASHACALEASGRAWCWGGNERGQLGDGSRNDKAEPSAVRTELRFSELSAGAAHTCALAGEGVPFCWGHNLNGQLGDGSRNDQTAPRTVGGGLQFRSIVSGWDHTCGLTSNGNAFCWGLNSQGQLGDGSTLDQLVPTLVHGSVTTLVAGSAHTCGVSEGAVLCWGANNFGQLGDGTTTDRMQPTEVVGLPSRPAQLAAGAVHTCALVQGGEVYCWGQNLQGQLGDGSRENRPRPVAVGGGLRFDEIFAGGALTCGIATDGGEYCWGLNQSGQLGDGTRVSRPSPTRVTR